MTAALPPRRRGLPLGTARKVGRGSLASSHAGTRLPIAVIQDPGRSPSARRGLTADAGSSFLKRAQKQGGARRASQEKPYLKRLPTAALSASGVRVKVRELPLSLPIQAPLCLIVGTVYTPAWEIARPQARKICFFLGAANKVPMSRPVPRSLPRGERSGREIFPFW